MDALEIIESIKGEHEQLAVSIIKTNLKGVARNLIGNETTIAEVISRLKNNVKGETVEVLSAKLMNLQRNKTANQYTQEVEQMTKSLEDLFRTDGLSLELARSYSTRHAVKAMTKNCTIDKVKTIMQAGTFNTMNEAISKFETVAQKQPDSQTLSYITKITRSAVEIADEVIIEVIITIPDIIRITDIITTMVITEITITKITIITKTTTVVETPAAETAVGETTTTTITITL